ncbi:monovalent cation/H(+) antiporter subunit G [Brachybacterium sp. NBEC-018]|uniref:monovalent cation/H(+) antiporter subunit G n=1 Tax=Brachybacterium sp. NBEC-018 TaxID=2996004 RepID=UPI002175104D|nr:monovalent cation/H(+) antiporter subunit G [Brachybacterium sp. NBEC-018]UVY85307.1 monovalent cation/H(+) antiporter subunit G [Brachybacterium sp. NBEC-018]
MTALEILAVVLMSLGVLLTVVAAVGLHRFDGVLARMHATSKPQTLGLVLVFGGVALLVGSWALAGMLVLVLVAQMLTVPVASTMVGRAAFRRGFVRGGEYAIDELTPRLADVGDEDDDEDGFLDEGDDPHEGLGAQAEDHRFPENVVAAEDAAGAVIDHNWDVDEDEDDDLGPDPESYDLDLGDETEREAEEVAERDARR